MLPLRNIRQLCCTLTVLAITACFGWTTPASAERRLAFVVGIDDYPHLGPDARLHRAVSDAEGIATRLSKLDFEVTTLAAGVQVGQDVFLRRFAAWTRGIEPGDLALFYFAGHGVGIANANYLVPADMPDLKDADEYTFKAHAIAETEVRDRIKSSGARVTLLILDACRNNPFESDGRGITMSRGLQPIEPTKGVLTIYSAGYGQTALDRLSDGRDTDPNSVFTRVFLGELQKPGENLIDLSENIRDEVSKLAQSVGHDQVPAVDNQLLGGRAIYLVKPASLPVAQDPVSADEAAWRSIQSSDDRASLRGFIDAFPASPHRAAVEKRLGDLDHVPALSASAQPPTQASADDIAWRYLRTTTDAAALHDFIGDYPSSQHRTEAQALLASLTESAWQTASNSRRADDVREFLTAFPGSAREGSAQARLRALDDADWAAARNRAGVEHYVAEFPDGRHRADADRRLAALDLPKPTPRVARSLPEAHAPVHLLAPRRPVVERRRSVAAVSYPARPEPSPRKVRDVKAPVSPADGRCFEVKGERYCP